MFISQNDKENNKQLRKNQTNEEWISLNELCKLMELRGFNAVNKVLK